MKKILLTLLCLFTVSIGLQAKTETLELTTENLGITGSGTYNSFTSVVSESMKGFKFATIAARNTSKDNAIQMNKERQSGIMMTENENGYTIKTVTIVLQEDFTNSAVVEVSGSSDPYPAIKYIYNNKDNSTKITNSSLETVKGSVNKDSGLTTKISNIDSKYIAVNYTAGGSKSGAVYINKIIMEYEVPSDEPETPTFNLPGVDDDKPWIMYVDHTFNFNEIASEAGLGHPELEYSFSVDEDNTDVIIDETEGTLTSVKRTVGGKSNARNIHFTTKQTDKYLSGEGSFKFYVKGNTPTVSFQHETVEGKVGTGIVYQHASVDTPDLPITYSLLNEDEPGESTLLTFENDADKDAFISTGEIKPSACTQAGTARVRATTTATTKYEEGTDSYLITIKDAGVVEEEVPCEGVTFDFTVENAHKMTSTSNNSYYAENPAEDREGKVTIVVNGKYRHWSSNGDYDLRLYKAGTNESNTIEEKNGQVTISVPVGYNILSVDVIATKAGDKLTGWSGDESTSSSEDGSYDGTTTMWTTNEGSVVTKVTLEAPETVFIDKIDVAWQTAMSGLPSAELSFAKKSYGLHVGEDIEVNPVTNPYGVEVKYSVDCNNSDIHPGEQEENICTVKLNDEDGKLIVHGGHSGTFTLTAKSDPTDTYRSGYAIMRINVFPEYDDGAITASDGAAVLANNVVTGDTKSGTIYIDVPSTVSTLRYFVDQLPDEEDPSKAAAAPKRLPAPKDEIQPGDDWEEYDSDNGISVEGHGHVHYAMNYYSYFSPKKTLYYNLNSDITSVEAIDAEEAGEVKWFDLSGRELKGAAEKGISIRMQGGKATKVIK